MTVFLFNTENQTQLDAVTTAINSVLFSIQRAHRRHTVRPAEVAKMFAILRIQQSLVDESISAHSMTDEEYNNVADALRVKHGESSRSLGPARVPDDVAERYTSEAYVRAMFRAKDAGISVASLIGSDDPITPLPGESIPDAVARIMNFKMDVLDANLAPLESVLHNIEPIDSPLMDVLNKTKTTIASDFSSVKIEDLDKLEKEVAAALADLHPPGPPAPIQETSGGPARTP